MDWAETAAQDILNDLDFWREGGLDEAARTAIATALRAAERRGMERAKAIAGQYEKRQVRGCEEESAAYNIGKLIQAEIDKARALTNAAYAAGLAASGREAELVKALTEGVELVGHSGHAAWVHAFYLEEAKAWEIRAKAWFDKTSALLTPTEDREYQIAVEKLMEEGSG